LGLKNEFKRALRDEGCRVNRFTGFVWNAVMTNASGYVYLALRMSELGA
jgi:hypothetical protein